MAETAKVKDQVKALLDRLPDDCTLEDVQYHLYVLGKVARSEARMREAGTIAQEDAKTRFATWLNR